MKQTSAMSQRGWRWWAWHVFGRHGRVQACRRLAELEVSQWASTAALAATVQERLDQQLTFASKSVPHYRQLGLGMQLGDYPVLSRFDLQQRFDQLNSPLARQHEAWTLTSSGSSGVVIRVRRDMATQAWATACAWRGDCWGAQLSPESRQLSVLSNVGNIVGRRRALSPAGSFLHNRYVLNAMSINVASARSLLKSIDDFKPELLSGYPSVLYLLARFGLQLGLQPPRIKKVLPTAESCSKDEAAAMESFYRVPVLQRYGSHEFSTMAHQCEAGNWHWHQEVFYPEVVMADGSIASTGKGNLLCTSLINQSMPLIRYEIGDVVDLTPLSCPCGRGLATFSSIDGRASEYAYCPDGRWISSHAFLAPLRSLPLLQFQLIQEVEDGLRLLVVASHKLSDEEQRWIQRCFYKIHDGQLQVSIEQVSELQRSPGGKLLRMINRLRRPGLPS